MCVTHIHAHTDMQTYTQINTRDSGCGLDSSEKFASLHTDLGFLARKSKQLLNNAFTFMFEHGTS